MVEPKEVRGGVVISSLTSNQTATAATTVLVGPTWTMPANLATVGMVIRLKMFYRFVRTTGAPSITYNLNIAGSSVATYVGPTLSSAVTSGGMLEGTITILSIGSGGTLMSGFVGVNDHGSTTGGNVPQLVNITATAINTTISNLLSMDMKMTTAVAGNTLTISQAYVEIVKI